MLSPALFLSATSTPFTFHQMDPLTEIANYFYSKGHNNLADAVVQLPEFSPQSRKYMHTRNAIAELLNSSDEVSKPAVKTILQAYDSSITLQSIETTINTLLYLEMLYIKKDTDSALALLKALPQSTDIATRQNLTALLVPTSQPSSSFLSSLQWDPSQITTVSDARNLLVENLMRLSSLYIPNDSLERTMNDALTYRRLSNPSFGKDPSQILPTTLKRRLTLPHDSGEVWFAKYSPNGRYLATGSKHWRVTVHDANDNYSLAAVFELHSGPITYISWDADSSHILTISSNQTLRVWSLQEKTCITEFDSLRGARLSAASFAPDYATTNHIIMGSNDGGLLVGDISDGEADDVKLVSDEHIEDFVILNNNTIWALNTNHELIELDTKSFKPGRTLLLPQQAVSITAAPSCSNCDHVLVNLKPNTLVLVNTGNSSSNSNSGKQTSPATIPPHIETFFYMPSVSKRNYILRGCAGGGPTGLVISGTENGEIWLWAQQGNIVGYLNEHSGSVNCVTWRDNETGTSEWASASDDGTVCVWTVKS